MPFWCSVASLFPSVQEDHARYQGIASATDACVCMLRIMTVPGIPRQLVSEDRVEALLAFLKFHLSANVLALADARLCRQYRPNMAAAAGEPFVIEHRG